jgi:hypothetical protein
MDIGKRSSRILRLGTTTAVLAILALASATASDAATFVVNVKNDDVDATIDGRCDTDTSLAGRQCSLRGALAESNNRTDHDRIEFDPTVFDGTLGDAINPVGGFLGVAGQVDIDAGDCGAGGFPKPCAGIDAPDGNSALVVGGDDVSIRGLAIYGAGFGGGGVRAFGADRLRVRNSWFGRRLNGTSSPNGAGSLSLEVSSDGSDDSDDAVIGGRGADDANVFAGGSSGVLVDGGDRNHILGNLFGVDQFGTTLTAISTPVSIAPDTDIDEPAVANTVGTELSPAAAASPECDGGCNAITNAGGDGVGLQRTGEVARDTTIAGNFIGLRPDGESALENEFFGIWVAGSDGTTIGGSKFERNYITGGRQAWRQDAGSKSLLVKGNLIGFDSTGQTPTDPPDGAGGGDASFVRSVADAPTTVTGNRYALAPSTTGLVVAGADAVVTSNTFGLQLGGGGLAPAANTRAIAVPGRDAVIGRSGAGNVIANMSWLNQDTIAISGGAPAVGDRNLIQGNLIGVDRGGDPHPITGDGIGLNGDADDNRVGGSTLATENVISNVSGNPIQVSALGQSPNGNEFLRNHGSNNGTESPFELFVNLQGTSGFGNGDPSVHGGIEAPEIDAATRTEIQGSAAEGGAEIWIFRTGDAPGASPRNVTAFVTRTTANGSGGWSASFDRIPAGSNLTALQTDAADGSSELALVVAP